jgi:hypothetical protein
MNWGLKIGILYGGFVVLIVTMVVMSSRQKMDLVATDYYDQELKYEDQLNKMRASSKLEHQPELIANGNRLELVFPDDVRGKSISGNLIFFRSSDAQKDVAQELTSDTLLRRVVATEKLVPGYYQAKLNWKANEQEYYQEFSYRQH